MTTATQERKWVEFDPNTTIRFLDVDPFPTEHFRFTTSRKAFEHPASERSSCMFCVQERRHRLAQILPLIIAWRDQADLTPLEHHFRKRIARACVRELENP